MSFFRPFRLKHTEKGGEVFSYVGRPSDSTTSVRPDTWHSRYGSGPESGGSPSVLHHSPKRSFCYVVNKGPQETVGPVPSSGPYVWGLGPHHNGPRDTELKWGVWEVDHGVFSSPLSVPRRATLLEDP